MHHAPLNYGSVCSGIEAVSLAWQPLGWCPAWLSEIDPFPNAVLAHHYPSIRNLGDMTSIADRVHARSVPAPDILVGGTPCQAFSVAGPRNGLSDPRGALTLKFTELADAIDQTRQENDQPPVIIVWENVSGVLSDKSNAFGCLLGALAGEGCALEPAGRRWSNAGCVAGPRRRIAWRVLNAQYFGVAQRRRRVFLVASGREDLDPAEVLFEHGGLHGNPAAGAEAREDAATAPEDGAGSPGGLADDLPRHYGTVPICFGGGNTSGPIEHAACLTARGHKCDFEVETFAAQSVTGSTTHALNTANGGKGSSEDGTGRGVPIVAQPKLATGNALAFSQNVRGEVRLESSHGQIAGALGRGGGKPGQGYPAIAIPYERVNVPRGDGCNESPIIAFSAKDHGGDALVNISPTLRAGSGADSHANVGVMPAVAFDTGDSLYCRDVAGTVIGQHGKHSYDVEIIGTRSPARSVALRGRDGGATAELGDEIASALRASGGGGDKAHVVTCTTAGYFEGRLLDPEESGWSEWSGWRVRRLMPVECERLQGMPDNYTLVPYRGKLAADGPRYKAIGNSMAVPCVEWLGRRIDRVLRRSGRVRRNGMVC